MEREAVDYVINRLFELSSKFSDIGIRYEFDNTDNYHLIEITPLELFENDENYLNAEIALEEEFRSRFTGQNILFVSTESLNRVNQPILILVNMNLRGLDYLNELHEVQLWFHLAPISWLLPEKECEPP